MAIRFYDQALVDKIQKWIRDPNMRVLKPNEVTRLFQLRADQTDDKPLTLPLVAVSRDSNVSITLPAKQNLSFDGHIIGENVDRSIQLNAIPIQLNYQLDIYTKRYEEGDEYLRNFIFNFVNYPKMVVELPYNNTQIEHVCYVRLESEVIDNSDVSEKLFPDEFTRWTLNLRIDDAYLFSIPVHENVKLGGYKVYVKDAETSELEYQGGDMLLEISDK